MAPNLDDDQHALLQSMISTGRYTAVQIAKAVDCSVTTVAHGRSNLLHFGSTKAPKNGCGRPLLMPKAVLDALCRHLEKNPTTLQSELGSVVQEEFGLRISNGRITAALLSVGWSTRVISQHAEQPDGAAATSASLAPTSGKTRKTGHKGRKAAVKRRAVELRGWTTRSWGLEYNRRIIAQKLLRSANQDASSAGRTPDTIHTSKPTTT